MELSAYERQRLKTMEANQAVLKSLGLDEPLVPKSNKRPTQPRKRKVSNDPDYEPERRTRVSRGVRQVKEESSDEDDDFDTDDIPKPVRKPKTKTDTAPLAKDIGSANDGSCITVEAAKTSRSKCRGCMEPIEASSLRCGMESWMVGRQVTVWQHPKCLLNGLSVTVEASGRTKCKQSKQAFEVGERRLSATAHTTTAHIKLSAAPALLRPVYAAVPANERPAPSQIAGFDQLDTDERAALEAALAAADELVAVDEPALVEATPTTTQALSTPSSGASGKDDDERQPIKGLVTKAKGKVAWRFGGAVCFGTLLPAQETKTTCYARTHKGNTKTLTKGGTYWWLLE